MITKGINTEFYFRYKSTSEYLPNYAGLSNTVDTAVWGTIVPIQDEQPNGNNGGKR